MDRVFLDANVLFSAAWMGHSGLSRLWRLKGVVLVTSLYALEEARRNLEEIARIERLEALAKGLEVFNDDVSDVAIPSGVILPSDDTPIMQAAIASKSSHLLSGDLKAFGRYYGRTIASVLIQKPSSYLSGK